MSEKIYYTPESEVALMFLQLFPEDNVTLVAAVGSVNTIYETIWEGGEPAKPSLTEEQELKWSELIEAIKADVAKHKGEGETGEGIPEETNSEEASEEEASE